MASKLSYSVVMFEMLCPREAARMQGGLLFWPPGAKELNNGSQHKQHYCLQSRQQIITKFLIRLGLCSLVWGLIENSDNVECLLVLCLINT